MTFELLLEQLFRQALLFPAAADAGAFLGSRRYGFGGKHLENRIGIINACRLTIFWIDANSDNTIGLLRRSVRQTLQSGTHIIDPNRLRRRAALLAARRGRVLIAASPGDRAAV